MDYLTNLSPYHRWAIAITVVVPLVIPTVMGYVAIENLYVRATIDGVVILLWLVFVVVVVSRLAQHDTREANRLVAEQVDPLAEQVSRLGEQHNNSIEDLQLQVQDLERRVQAALESLGENLPPKTVFLRAKIIAGAATVSFSVSVSGGSRWGRIRARFCRTWSRISTFVWGERRSNVGK